MKRWKLVVTELGSHTAIAEATVDAPNWMAAFKMARGRIGEPETIPIGGSCTVAPDGRVNVLDPQRRRGYILSPVGDVPAVAPGPASPAQPAMPPAAAPTAEPPKRPRPKTMAYIPDAMVPPVAPPVAEPSKVPKKTMAYLPGQMGLPPVAPREVPVGAPPAPMPPPAQLAPAPPPIAPVAPVAAPPMPAWPVVGSAPAAAPQPYVPPAPPVAAPQPPVARTGPTLLGERSVPPTEDSPVHYHERSLEAPRDLGPQDLETLVRAQLDDVRRTITSDPSGHFVRVLVHGAGSAGQGDPLVVGQWKGWRDETSVQFPAAAQSIELTLEAEPEESYPAAADDSRLATVLEAFDDIWFLASPAAGLEFTARLLEELFADVLIVAAVREAGSTADFHVGSTRGGAEVASIPDRLPNEGLVGLAAAHPGRAIAVLDANRDPRHRPAADGHDGGPYLAVAAAHGGAVLGVLRLTRDPGKAPFSASDADLVRCAADRLAAFLRSRGTHLD
ncbi:MAG: GAF domain-containing protein [Polyangiales bacterium]